MTLTLLPLMLHGHVGMGTDLLIYVALIGLLILLAITAGVVNVVVILRPEKRPPGFMAWTIVSILAGLLTTAGGFIFNPNAPYDKNWAFLIGGLCLLAATLAARLRMRALNKRVPLA